MQDKNKPWLPNPETWIGTWRDDWRIMGQEGYLKDKKLAMLLVMMGMNVLLVSTSNVHPMQYYSILSIFLIWLYNNQVGCKKWKYFFYIYYPVHVVILAALAWL